MVRVLLLVLVLSLSATNIFAKTPPPKSKKVVSVAKESNDVGKTDILYEGWHKVLSGGSHVGYYVQRYEFEPKTKNMISTYFLKTNTLGGNVTEGLKARSTDALKPLSYQYTGSSGGKPKLIDAHFDGNKLRATITADGKSQAVEKNLPKGAFLSTFLAYIMLQNKAGLKVGNDFSYVAIAEEDATPYEGTALIKQIETKRGVETFKVLNVFNKIQFISFLTAKAEVLATKSPLLSIETEYADKDEATKGFQIDNKSISLLFGTTPGNGTLVIPGKKEGVPGGKGIQIKPSTEEPKAEEEKK